MKFKILFPFVFLVLLMGISQANVSAPTFFLYVNNTGSIGFLSQTEKYVKLEVTSGAFNCSNASLTMDLNHGRLRFLNNESVSFTTTFNVSKVNYNGALVTSGDSNSQTANKYIVIEWWITIEPWVPYLFILGMIGLGSMFGGSLYSVHLFKQKEYKNALVQGVTFIALGFGLFMGWVFA